jgi:hypothetical protein
MVPLPLWVLGDVLMRRPHPQLTSPLSKTYKLTIPLRFRQS